MPRHRIRAHYEQLSEFERGRIIRLKEAEWVESGRFQRHDVNGRPRAAADRENRLTVRSDVTVPDLSLSSIRCKTHTRVSTVTIHRRLIE
ncbi:HTH_Tnp_Tc3_2 domain-containing protein [Trichonephila clavipes]|nr:HTH_Tnp_Tc3_2 domain-containing protein [Trichonephila clavipes]